MDLGTLLAASMPDGDEAAAFAAALPYVVARVALAEEGFVEPLRNCWTCGACLLVVVDGEERGPTCAELTLDEEEDADVLAWIQSSHDDFSPMPPLTADDCPRWSPR
jgi:hypothetical protein